MDNIDKNILDEIPVLRSLPAEIMVAGVGGAGGNAVDHMWRMGISGVNFVVCNTDIQALEKSPVQRKICLGDGLGAGNDARVGEQKTKSSLDEVRRCFEGLGTKMLFIAAGMGGGTGTGASPIIAQLAKEMDILTVAIVSMPPESEGPLRMQQAREGIDRLREFVDSLIVLSNDAINELYGDLPIEKAFDKANDILAMAAKGIAEIVTIKSNLVNVDFADVCKVMSNSGCAVIGVSTASGDNRAEEVIDASLSSPLFGGASIAGAKNVLLNLSTASSDDLTLREANRAIDRIQQYAGDKDDDGNIRKANIIWGTSVKPELGDKLEAIVVVTGFPSDYYRGTISGDVQVREMVEKPMPKPDNGGLADFKEEVRTPAPQKIRGAINVIGKPTRHYNEVERRKATPAFVARNVQFVTLAAGSRRRAADRHEDGTQEMTGADDSQKLF